MMAHIGWKYKKIMKCTNSYTRQTTQAPNHSFKRKRLDSERQGTSLVVNLIIPGVTCEHSQRKAVRYTIFYQNINVLDAPLKEHWWGSLCIISLIRKVLKIARHSRRNTRQTLEEVMRCAQERKNFEGMIKPINKVGQHIILLPGSFERNSHRELNGSALWLPYENTASEWAS